MILNHFGLAKIEFYNRRTVLNYHSICRRALNVQCNQFW